MKKIILISLLCFLSCNQTTMLDVYREYLPKKTEGVVDEVIKYKGDGYELKLERSGKMESIGVNESVGKKARVGDYFMKIENSNKCKLKRNDSIICLDCIKISKEDRDSLGKISEWKMFEKNKWMDKRDEKASQ